jgi:hypothetical protein
MDDFEFAEDDAEQGFHLPCYRVRRRSISSRPSGALPTLPPVRHVVSQSSDHALMATQ